MKTNTVRRKVYLWVFLLKPQILNQSTSLKQINRKRNQIQIENGTIFNCKKKTREFQLKSNENKEEEEENELKIEKAVTATHNETQRKANCHFDVVNFVYQVVFECYLNYDYM